ncbi:hypothetical protein LSAT2_028400 [Lamellibrachia satsuma]|nr:hypothetical protein LSAT2_028400 [Lamellibrachia satsuma]
MLYSMIHALLANTKEDLPPSSHYLANVSLHQELHRRDNAILRRPSTAEEKANGPSMSRNKDNDDAFVNSRVERKAPLPAPCAVSRPETLPLSNRQNRRNPVSCSRHTDLNAPQGIFGTTTSKYYPNERCSWKIELPRFERVRLHFLRFDLESASHFRYDWVKVYDGSNVYAPLVGSFRGTTVPGDIIST